MSKERIKKLRIDPGNKPAVILVRQIQIDTVDLTDYALKKNFAKHDTNGKRLGANGFLFTNTDPHFAFKVPAFEGESANLTFTMLVSEIPGEIAGRLK